MQRVQALNDSLEDRSTLWCYCRLATSQILTSTAVAWKLDRAWQIKPMLDGKAVQQAAGLSKPSPLLGKLTKAMLEWQFAHPDGTVSECRSWLEQNHAAVK